MSALDVLLLSCLVSVVAAVVWAGFMYAIQERRERVPIWIRRPDESWREWLCVNDVVTQVRVPFLLVSIACARGFRALPGLHPKPPKIPKAKVVP